VQEGLTSIRKILQQRRNSAREMISTIDNLKRLCIDHYFEEEIESAMGAACVDLVRSDDLFEATLAFRLMREAGHDVSAGQFAAAIKLLTTVSVRQQRDDQKVNFFFYLLPPMGCCR
jgi:hypothetical protein